MLNEHEFNSSLTLVAKRHFFVIPVEKEQRHFSILPATNCSILLVTLWKAELVCDHDSVLLLLDIWSVFWERTVVIDCCPYSVLGWNSQVRTGLLLTRYFEFLFLNNNNSRGANMKIPGLVTVYSTVYCRSRRLYFIVIWASKYLFLKENSLNNVFKQKKVYCLLASNS